MHREQLRADCSRCTALCCTVTAFGRSADFAIDKPAGVPCLHLLTDFRCGIHDRLTERGFPGCRAFDCLGAGQRVTAAAAGPVDVMPVDVAVAFPLVRDLHELMWLLEEVLALRAAVSVHAEAAALRGEVDGLADRVTNHGLSRSPERARAESDRVWAAVDVVLRHASALARAGLRGVRFQRADLAGRDLRRRRLGGADLRGASLLGADLRGALLDRTDLVGADLRGADLRGADLSTALFLTPPQVSAARGDARTALPATLPRPAHWPPATAAPALAGVSG